MAPYTGGCAFSFGCDRYKVGCGYCPLLGAKKEMIYQENRINISKNI